MVEATNSETFEEIVEWAYSTLPQKIRATVRNSTNGSHWLSRQDFGELGAAVVSGEFVSDGIMDSGSEPGLKPTLV